MALYYTYPETTDEEEDITNKILKEVVIIENNQNKDILGVYTSWRKAKKAAKYLDSYNFDYSIYSMKVNSIQLIGLIAT